MTLESELRDVLATEADRHEGPVPDLAALRARGLARRRRRGIGMAVSGLAAVALVAAVGVGVAAGPGDTETRVVPAGPPSVVPTTGVPWCVPNAEGGQLIVGEGEPIRTLCHAVHGAHLWHHAGTTILVREGTVQLVADGRLTSLGTGGDVSMSHDGRLAASLSLSSGNTNCGVLPLEVYEVATATRVATTEVETSCGHLAGMDDRGRVYVTVADDQPGVLDVRMFDTASGQWTRVSDVPSRQGGITYVTTDGFAVQSEEVVVTAPDYGATLPVASVEGSVDDAGRFVPRREVPIGRGRWSLDRSLVADQRPEGVVVRSADLTRLVELDLPPDLFAQRSGRLPEVDMLWESPTTLLAVSGRYPSSTTYRCDAGSGSCQRLDRPGWPAFGNNALVGG